MNLAKIGLSISSLFLVLAFVFIPHTIELSATLDTWFPYKGLTIYKDFNSFHFPLGRFILFPVHLLSNWNLEIDPFIGLGIGVGNLLAIYFFGRKHLFNLATGCALLFFAIFYWYFATAVLYFHEMLVGLLLTFSLTILYQTVKEERVSSTKIFLLGLVLSLAESSGQIATPTVLVEVIIISYLLIREKQNLAKKFILLFTGLALPFLLLSLYFLGKGAFFEFIYWNSIFYFTYSTAASSLSELPQKELLAFYLPLVALLFTIAYKLKTKAKVTSTLLTTTVLTISTLPFVLYSNFHPHHLNYPLGILAVATGVSVNSLIELKNRKKNIYIFVVVFVFLGSSTFLPWYIEKLSPPSLRITNDVYPGDSMYDAIGWVKQNTKSDERLMVVGDPLFYMRADRLPASRPIKSTIISWEPIEKIGKEIRSTPADYWIVDTKTIDSLLKIYSKQDMVDFIKSELKSYKKAASFGSWEIWKHN